MDQVLLGTMLFPGLGREMMMKGHACDASAQLRDCLHSLLSDKFKLDFSISGVQCWPFPPI